MHHVRVPTGTMWFGRRLLIAVAVAAWGLVVIVATGEEVRGSSWMRIPDLTSLLAAALFLTALLGLVMIVFLRPPIELALEPRPRRSLRSLVVMAVGIAAVVIAVGPRDLPEEDDDRAAATAGSVAADGDARAERRVEGVDRSEMVALIVIATVAGAALYWSGDRRPPDVANDDEDENSLREVELAPAIIAAAEILSGPDDPRRSVMASYAGLERALAERGRGRRPTETPTEHLERVLGAAPVLAEPALLLGGLYEVARFSDQPISIADQRRAAAALDRARHGLTTAPETTS